MQIGKAFQWYKQTESGAGEIRTFSILVPKKEWDVPKKLNVHKQLDKKLLPANLKGHDLVNHFFINPTSNWPRPHPDLLLFSNSTGSPSIQKRFTINTLAVHTRTDFTADLIDHSSNLQSYRESLSRNAIPKIVEEIKTRLHSIFDDHI